MLVQVRAASITYVNSYTGQRVGQGAAEQEHWGQNRNHGNVLYIENTKEAINVKCISVRLWMAIYKQKSLDSKVKNTQNTVCCNVSKACDMPVQPNLLSNVQIIRAVSSNLCKDENFSLNSIIKECVKLSRRVLLKNPRTSHDLNPYENSLQLWWILQRLRYKSDLVPVGFQKNIKK